MTKQKDRTDKPQGFYFESAERNASLQFEKFKEKLSRGSQEIAKKDLLKMEIERLEEIVKSKYHLIEKAHQGYTDLPTKELIEYLKEKLQESDSFIPVKDKYQQFHAIVAYKYLNKLKKLSDNNSGNEYGIHQNKRDWVQDKWHEVRKKKPSDRQADLELQRMYKQEFDLEISTTQIQRFTGRAE